MDKLTHLSLFSGIGGLDLAAEWAGFETAGQCEWADYPTRVLEKHWPDVPRWQDIRTLTKESFYERTGLQTVDLISGGFPCQPHSLAGKRLGEKDSRHLWPEFMRVVRELRPGAVVAENVPGILSTIHDTVCSDLEQAGYSVWTLCVPAYAVGAPHERYRVAVIAVSHGQSGLQANSAPDSPGALRKAWQHAFCGNWAYMPGTYWAVHQPPVFGMDDGIPGGVDGRVKYKAQMTALGNAVVPQQFYPIFCAIAELEMSDEHDRPRGLPAGKEMPRCPAGIPDSHIHQRGENCS